MQVFRRTSFRSYSKYILQRAARDHEVRYGKDEANTHREKFYVDDLLK